MCIQQIRNETLKITYGGVTFLLDPWQQDRGQGPCFRAVRDDRKDVRSPMDDLPFAPSEILGGCKLPSGFSSSSRSLYKRASCRFVRAHGLNNVWIPENSESMAF